MSEAGEAVESLEGVLDNPTVIEGEENTLSPAEEKASASGWRPEEEWKGDSDDWVDAKTFNRNGEFMSRIQKQSKQLDNQSSELDNLRAGMKQLGDHNKKIAEQEYKKAIAALKKEKIAALEESDHAAVEDIAEKIDELKENKKELEIATKEEAENHPVQRNEVAEDPHFTEWATQNAWYKDNVSLRGAADAIGMEYADKNVGAPIEEVLRYVTGQMREVFPDKFGVTQKASPSAVTEPSGTGKRVKKNKYTEKDLSSDQREFAKMFVSTGAFENVQEYVDSLVKSGDL